MKQVAERAGVSTATVSRALSSAPTVSVELNRRVREAARQLHYEPNRISRNLRTRTTRAVGVIIPDIESPFFSKAVCGIEEVLHAVVLPCCLPTPGRILSANSSTFAPSAPKEWQP